MKPGTIVRVRDGRLGTVVYHGLDGYGIRWGVTLLSPANRALIEMGGLFGQQDQLSPEGQKAARALRADAMLREPYPGAALPCVGDDYIIHGG